MHCCVDHALTQEHVRRLTLVVAHHVPEYAVGHMVAQMLATDAPWDCMLCGATVLRDVLVTAPEPHQVDGDVCLGGVLPWWRFALYAKVTALVVFYVDHHTLIAEATWLTTTPLLQLVHACNTSPHSAS